MPGIAETIRDLRESMGWNQRKLALKADLSPATISRIENGKLHPEPETLRKLAAVLPVSYEYLMRVAGYVEAHDMDIYRFLRDHYGVPEERLPTIGEVLHSLTDRRVPLLRAVAAAAR